MGVQIGSRWAFYAVRISEVSLLNPKIRGYLASCYPYKVS